MTPMTNGSDDWRDVSRLLCVRLDAMGDVLMTMPAMHAARVSGGGKRHLTLLTSPSGAEAGRLLADVDDVIVYRAPWVKDAPQDGGGGIGTLADRLRAGGFDAAVVFTVYSQSPLPAALLCLLAGIPLRLAHCRENPYRLLTHWVPETEPASVVRHEVQRQLDLVGHVGWRTPDPRLRLRVPERAMRRAHELLIAAGIDERRPWLVVHPGASAPSRRYPAGRFAAVVRSLVVEHGWQVLLTGGRSELGLVAALRHEAAVDAASLAGRLDLGEFAAVLARSRMLVSNNTGPVHVAAAVGTPVVDLYALTNPQHTPWRVPSRVLSHDVPCRFCYKSVCPQGHHRCLLGIEPEQVVAAVRALAGAGEDRSGCRLAEPGR